MSIRESGAPIYTSIGNRSNTVPNPALAVQSNDGKQDYRPAYTLVDSNAERTGRQ
ncbi:putative FAD synthase [Orchesella cincta]|uniref:Putative FAD synthase n=1 Tax=Orchesella cincta TaxID=48709 RepID=A0A1D2N1A1_ORCCI|nr:putative FAD synthase [Orchesella cincta]